MDTSTFRLSQCKILVADDDAVVRDVLARLLSIQGADVSTTGDANSARHCIEETAYDVVVSDLLMPHSGNKLVQWLIRQRPECAVVVASSYADDSNVFRDALKRQVCLINKPFSPERLFQAVESSLKMSRRRMALLDELNRSIDHECLLTGEGEVWLVNAAWQHFAQLNGGQDSRGTNYRAVCELADGDDFACQAADAISLAMRGFEAAPIEYPCHSPSNEAWYHMTAHPLKLGDTALVRVRHRLLHDSRVLPEASTV